MKVRLLALFVLFVFVFGLLVSLCKAGMTEPGTQPPSCPEAPGF